MVTRATLIGDVVDSRAATDRADLHRTVTAAIDEVNARFSPHAPLRITVGDEYQGAFDSVTGAARAAFALTLRIGEHYDVRHGLGWGEVAGLQQEPRVEDGPGWWAARTAIEAVHADQQRAATAWLRTGLVVAPDAELPDQLEGALRAGLILRDRAVAGFDARSVSVLRGLLEGETQREIAERLGVSPSAVSQRVRADGLAALVLADEAWKGAGR